MGVQPRTLEIFEGMGVLRPILDASVPLRGQIVCLNGRISSRSELPLPADVPFGFIAIPQYETERVLAKELAMHGVGIERGLRLTAFEQDADGVTTTLSGNAGDSRLRCRYLIGAVGACAVSGFRAPGICLCLQRDDQQIEKSIGLRNKLRADRRLEFDVSGFDLRQQRCGELATPRCQ